ncbi:hypothetical protein BHE74_00059444 [Ensete ventricosum]|nr:hypothetical protein BHE74_00059444 [Ensete ventricosum]
MYRMPEGLSIASATAASISHRRLQDKTLLLASAGRRPGRAHGDGEPSAAGRIGRAEEGVVLRLLLSPRLRPRATPLAQRRRAAPPLVEELQDKESLLRVQLLEQQLLEENVAIIPFLRKKQKLRGSIAPGLTKF